MKVVDAGVVVDLLIGRLDPLRLGGEALATPHLLDSEVLHVLRRLVLQGELSAAGAARAVRAFAGLALRRFPADDLHGRIWELRHTLSAYGATYVALTELTEATALLTTDARLANAPGPQCRIELLR